MGVTGWKGGQLGIVKYGKDEQKGGEGQDR